MRRGTTLRISLIFIFKCLYLWNHSSKELQTWYTLYNYSSIILLHSLGIPSPPTFGVGGASAHVDSVKKSPFYASLWRLTAQDRRLAKRWICEVRRSKLQGNHVCQQIVFWVKWSLFSYPTIVFNHWARGAVCKKQAPQSSVDTLDGKYVVLKYCRVSLLYIQPIPREATVKWLKLMSIFVHCWRLF